MLFKNCLIYLIGLPGVGKRTIGQEICKQADFRLIDNHRINNVVFPFVRVDGQTKMPPEIWQACDAIRDIAFETMVNIGHRDFNYVFTNMLLNDCDDERIYEHLARTADAIEACFLPVRLVCDVEEQKRRIVSADRDLLFKSTDASQVDVWNAKGLLEVDHPNCVTLDVTDLSVQHAATFVLDWLQGLYCKV